MGFWPLSFACCGEEGLQLAKPVVSRARTPIQPSCCARPDEDCEREFHDVVVVETDRLTTSPSKGRSGRTLSKRRSGQDQCRQEHSEQLLWACARGDLQAASGVLERLAENPCDSLVRLARDQLGHGALHFACASGCLELVRLLCEAPHSVDACAPGGRGQAGVVIAASYGHLPVVQYLAERHRALDASSAPGTWKEWDAVLAQGEQATPLPLLEPMLSSSTAAAAAAQGPDRIVLDRQAQRRGRAEVRSWLEQRLQACGGRHSYHEGEASQPSASSQGRGRSMTVNTQAGIPSKGWRSGSSMETVSTGAPSSVSPRSWSFDGDSSRQSGAAGMSSLLERRQKAPLTVVCVREKQVKSLGPAARRAAAKEDEARRASKASSTRVCSKASSASDARGPSSKEAPRRARSKEARVASKAANSNTLVQRYELYRR